MLAAGVQELAAAVETIDLPDPRPLAGDEVLIEVRAAGVANWDEFVCTGQWDVGRTPPMALGVAAAGVITAVGEAVGKWKEGDKVLTHPLPLRDQGTWAPSLIAAAALLARKPDAVSWDVGAAFPVPALTASQAMQGAGAVAFETEQVVAGPEDAFDPLADRGQMRPGAGLVLSARADDQRVTVEQRGGKVTTGVAL